MAKQTMDELVASGVPFNPLSADQGRAYGGNNGKKLKEVMGKNGWDDPRFLTESQVKKMGWTLMEDAKKSLVLYRENEQEQWTKILVYNGTQVIGLPSLADMQMEARKKLGNVQNFDDLVQKGKPFNPLSAVDGQGHGYSNTNLAALEGAMKEHGWTDPRFVTKAQVDHGKWSIKPGAPDLTVWQKGEDGWNAVPVFNAVFVEGFPSMADMQKDAAKALANQLRAAKEVKDARKENGEKAWVNPGPTMPESGVVMNPLSGNAGHVYGGKNADKLLAAMASRGWSDGRFVTAKAAEYAGLSLVDGAVPVVVNFPVKGQFVKTALYNAADVVGMPSLAAQYAGLAKLMSPKHGEMALSGLPFNPLDSDAESLVKDKETYLALQSAMDNRGLEDPRFVSSEDVAAKKLSVDGNHVHLSVSLPNGAEMYNAAQLVDFAKLPNLANWQALQDQAVVIEKERWKTQDAKNLGGGGEALAEVFVDPMTKMVSLKQDGLVTAFGGMAAIENFVAENPQLPAATVRQLKEANATVQGTDVPAALSVDMLGDVLAAAQTLKLRVSPTKIEKLLDGQGIKDGDYVGKVLAVDVDKGLVYQSQGRGRGEVLPLSALSHPITPDDVGKKLAIQVKDGLGKVATAEVGQAAALGR